MLTRIMGRVDQLTKVKGMFVHPGQVQTVISRHDEIAAARLVVERPGDTDIMTLEVELKESSGEELLNSIGETIKEVIKLKGVVKVVEPGSLAKTEKLIEDLRKWD